VSLVALSAAYGAGGSRIGPALAARLGVPFIDRAIPAGVAEALAVPLDVAAAHDEQIDTGWLKRMLAGFIGQDTVAPAPVPAETVTSEEFRRAAEEVLMRQAATGEGVILGRAGMILLRGNPRALRVRLTGPTERRVQQAIRLEALDEETARRRLRRVDHTQTAYMKHFYGVRLDDPSLYHLMLDSTAIGIDGCVELIALASRSLNVAASETPSC
jgi:cytidylate kinase